MGFFQKGEGFSCLTKKLLNPICRVLSVTKIHVIWQFEQNNRTKIVEKFSKNHFFGFRGPHNRYFKRPLFWSVFSNFFILYGMRNKKRGQPFIHSFFGFVDLWEELILWIHTAASLFSTIKSLKKKRLSCGSSFEPTVNPGIQRYIDWDINRSIF